MDEEANKKFKILSIDGGGIRGIIPAKVLSEMEKVLQERGECERLYDCFDLICGTSTGGIIAIGLALGISAKEILDLYIHNANKIFPSRILKFVHYLFKKSIYDREYLKCLLEKIYSKEVSGRSARLGDCKTRILIPSYNVRNESIYIFKTSHHPDLIRDYKILAHDVALATAAAPLYFSPHSFKLDLPSNDLGLTDDTYKDNIDGGIFANNPALFGLIEANSALGIDYSQIEILSLGTGQKRFTGKQRLSPLRLVDAFFSAQSMNVDNIIKFLRKGIGDNGKERFCYKRIQYIIKEEEELKLDDSSLNKLQTLSLIGEKLFEENSTDLNLFLKKREREFVPTHHD